VPRRRRGSAVGAALLSAVLLTVLGAQAQAQADVPEKAVKPPSSTHELPGHVAPLCGPAKPPMAAKADHRRR
jgi:hypothetical protein